MIYLTITAVFVLGFAVVWLLLSAHSPVSARLMAVTTEAPAASQAVSKYRTQAPHSCKPRWPDSPQIFKRRLG